VSPTDRRRILAQALQDKVTPGVRVFADLLLRKKRLGLVTAISARVPGHRRAREGSRARRRRECGRAHRDAERARLNTELERVTGKKVVLDTQLDPALVGGAYVRIGDRVIDSQREESARVALATALRSERVTPGHAPAAHAKGSSKHRTKRVATHVFPS
jgi:F0F1-type ATP synthase delta subunit